MTNPLINQNGDHNINIGTVVGDSTINQADFRNAHVQGNQIGAVINNPAAAVTSLAEITAEIQQLLKQLEASNPTATEAEQTAFLTAMIPPTNRERFTSAIQSASSAALDEIPYGPVLKALVHGWKNPTA